MKSIPVTGQHVNNRQSDMCSLVGLRLPNVDADFRRALHDLARLTTLIAAACADFRFFFVARLQVNRLNLRLCGAAACKSAHALSKRISQPVNAAREPAPRGCRAYVVEDRISHRGHKQGEQQAKRLPANDDYRDCSSLV